MRSGKGVTSESVAWDADITPAYMSLIETGRKIPSVMVLVRLAKALGVQVKEFFTFGV